MRIAGIALLIFTSAAMGCIASAGLKKRAEALLAVRRLTESLRLMIRYEALEVKDMARRLADDSTLSELEFTRRLKKHAEAMDNDCGVTFRDCWEAALSESTDGFSGEDKALLERIGSILGSCDCEGQISALTLAGEEAERLAAQAREEYTAKGRLYRSLGAVTGALIAVMLI